MQCDLTGGGSIDSCAVGRTKIAQLISLSGGTQFRVPARDRRIIDVNRIVRGAANRDQLFDQFVGYSADDQFRHRFNIVG
jgi:hypothetical protein